MSIEGKKDKHLQNKENKRGGNKTLEARKQMDRR